MPRSESDLYELLEKLDTPPLLLVLDRVQDPHNLGACLRTADAVGVHAVVAPKNRAVALTDTVRRIAAGAAEHVPFVQVTNLARMLGELQGDGIRIVGTADEAKGTLYDCDFNYALELPVRGKQGHIREFDPETFVHRQIRTGNHCFGCTAGCGSSCKGSLV